MPPNGCLLYTKMPSGGHLPVGDDLTSFQEPSLQLHSLGLNGELVCISDIFAFVEFTCVLEIIFPVR